MGIVERGAEFDSNASGQSIARVSAIACVSAHAGFG
jgi:hypothetical protein